MSLIIAIDGPSGAGKGTLSKALLEKYGFAYLDTGLMFRAAALKAHLHQIDLCNESVLVSLIQTLDVMDMGNVEALRSEENGQRASEIAVLPLVREALNESMRSFAKRESKQGKGAILDGRDIGSVVCPNATLKIYMTATLDVRAKRRFKELQTLGVPVIFKDVLQAMIERDNRDSIREQAPLKAADDAIIIDTSIMAIADVIDFVSNKIDAALTKICRQ